MLIKQGNHVINLDQVTDFVNWGETSIRFCLPFADDTVEEENRSVYLGFESKLEREKAFVRIVYDFADGVRLCSLD